MAGRAAKLFAWACLGLLVGPLAGPARAATDPAGDATDGDPDHDLLEVTFAESADEVRFTVRVKGKIEPPAAGIEEMSIRFRVTPKAVYNPAVSPQVGGSPHEVRSSTQDEYGVFRTGGLGYVLPEAPSSGSSSATWKVPKAYLDATAARRPLAGDWISDVRVSALAMGVAVDTATHPDVQLADDGDSGTRLHLRKSSDGARMLSSEAPTAVTPATATIAHGQTLSAEWRSAPLDKPLRLADLSAVVWLSTTTSTPVLSDENFHVNLLGEAPGGQRTLVAKRAEEVSPQQGASTNLFIAPGAPQRMPFQLLALDGQDRIPVDHRVVLEVVVSGFFADESGPMLVYYDGKDADSFLLAGKRPVPRADHSKCHAGNGVSELPRSQC